MASWPLRLATCEARKVTTERVALMLAKLLDELMAESSWSPAVAYVRQRLSIAVAEPETIRIGSRWSAGVALLSETPRWELREPQRTANGGSGEAVVELMDASST